VTYPNILILDYLKRAKNSTPEVRMRAEQYINLGYQRLLTFETPGGGFDWFGSPPAKTVLTAYGLLELTDMARVAPVDEGLIDRAKRVLLQRQQPDGSWRVDAQAHDLGAVADTEAATAYVTWALAHAGGAQAAVDRGLAFLESRVNDDSDHYVLALAANAWAAASPRAETTRRLLDMLERGKRSQGQSVSWGTRLRTLTRGGGDTAEVETTALAAQAFLRGEQHAGTASAALNFLVRQRGPSGAWATTQATILALQGLVAASGGAGDREPATIQVKVNGRDAEPLQITEKNADLMQTVDLTPYLGPAENQVTLSIGGKNHPLYQLISRCYVPWTARTAPARPTVDIRVVHDRATLRQNDVLTERVTIRSNAREPLSMLIADIGLAPGFAPEAESLNDLVHRRLIDRFEVTPRQLILYLRDLAPGRQLRLPIRLRARFPVRAKTPPSTVYEYYNPTNRRVSPPARIEVF
jgi:hypothetical protein